MKKYKILSICAAMALLSSGCSDNMGLQPDNAPVEGAAQTIRISASMDDNGSRLAYNETEAAMTLLWEKDDVLKVLNPNCETLISDFKLVDGDGTAKAHFEGTPAHAYEEGDKLYALYHNNLVDSHLDEDGNISISLKEQDGTLNQDFHLMYGETVYEGEGSSLTMNLQNLVNIIKVVIPTDKALTSINLQGYYRTSGTLVLQNSPSSALNQTFHSGDLVYNRDVLDWDENGQYIAGNGVTVTGLFEPVDGEVTVYFYVLPVKVYREKWDSFENDSYRPIIKAYDVEGAEYFNTKELGWKQLEKGKFYQIHTGIFKIVDFENESKADGSIEKPYELKTADQFYSFMMRCYKKYLDRNNNDYRDCNYRMTSNIDLDGRMGWNSFDFYGQKFDGGGYTLSGTVNGAVFSHVSNATICNLNLDLLVTNTPDTGYDYAGSLAGYVNNTTILNCGSRSTIKVRADRIGGLVGYLERSNMVGCWYDGKIEIVEPGWFEAAGGLAAYMDSGSMVEVCYSTAEITGDYSRGHVASVVCHNVKDDEGNNGLFRGCWACSNIDNLIAFGSYTACLNVEEAPTAEQYAEMNAALTNNYYEFDVTTGAIVPKKPSTSLPDIEIEDL